MNRSDSLFTQAQQYIPGGVNSPARAFVGVGGIPRFISHAQGPYIYDVDGCQYIDYVGSWGPMILGHNDPIIKQAVIDTVQHGLSFGAPTEIEVKMAKLIHELMPSIESIRMVNSGTEATMSAIRLARGYTGRTKIIKFEGCYHGHADSLLVKAGSGLLTCGQPSSLGIPNDFAKHTLTCTYNDIFSVEQMFNSYPNDIAAVIIEPVAGNMNCIPPVDHFLTKLRKLCDHYQALLIIDEVMTGFRVALGGAQAYYQVKPDITCLGKIIGGGMPVGAFGGRKEIMSLLAPKGDVYQAGTLSGNPVAMAAGFACLTQLRDNALHQTLNESAQLLADGLRKAAKKHQIPFVINQVGGMFGLFFTDEPEITHYQQVINCHLSRFKQFFHLMLAKGVYLAPSAFEAGFISTAHTKEIINATIEFAEDCFSQLD